MTDKVERWICTLRGNPEPSFLDYVIYEEERGYTIAYAGKDDAERICALHNISVVFGEENPTVIEALTTLAAINKPATE